MSSPSAFLNKQRDDVMRSRSGKVNPNSPCQTQVKITPNIHPAGQLGFVIRGLTAENLACLDSQGKCTLEHLHNRLMEGHLLVIKDSQRLLDPNDSEGFDVPQYLDDFADKLVGFKGDQKLPKEKPFAKDDPSCFPKHPHIRALGTNVDELDKEEDEEEIVDAFSLQGQQPPQKKIKNAAQRIKAEIKAFLSKHGMPGTPEETYKIGREWHTDGNAITFLMAQKMPRIDEGMSRRTVFVDANKLLTTHSAERQTIIKGLIADSGPDLTLESTVGKQLERIAEIQAHHADTKGTVQANHVKPEGLDATIAKKRQKKASKQGVRALNREGTMLTTGIPKEWCSAEELEKREKGWKGHTGRWRHLCGPLVKTCCTHGKPIISINPMHFVRFRTAADDDDRTRDRQSSSDMALKENLDAAYDLFNISEQPVDQEFPTRDARLLHGILTPGIEQHAYSHLWEEGDLIVFDNRGLLHSVDMMPDPMTGEELLILPHLFVQTVVKTINAISEWK